MGGRKINAGRKSMPKFLGSAIVTTIAGLLSCATPNYVTLLILRGIVGFGLGGANVFTTLGYGVCSEFENGDFDDCYICFLFNWNMFGGAARLVVITYGWRVLFRVCLLPSHLALLFYNTVPEFPRYLYLKGRCPTTNKSSLNAPLITTENETRETSSFEGFLILEDEVWLPRVTALCWMLAFE
ncbi:organic cation/carnitine transporter 7-like protein [Tanacetum coccineum]|uniref:Organic cation/carnitine transporter 7-like protein n=1 Tax=Tanacetum coccineum TaxID=301880 RepID=A0ABQ5BS03_9ASTR